MEDSALIAAATSVRLRAYAKYSRFQVGAALLTTTDQVFLGCNVENISYGLTLCAERSALVSAVAAGARHFRTIAIVADTRDPVSPCGACRQVLAELAPDLRFLLANLEGDIAEFTMEQLLPRAKTGILDTP